MGSYPDSHDVWECGLCSFAACDVCMRRNPERGVAKHAEYRSIFSRKPGERCCSTPCRRTCREASIYRSHQRSSTPGTPRRPPAGPFEAWEEAKREKWLEGGTSDECWQDKRPDKGEWFKLLPLERLAWEQKHARMVVAWEAYTADHPATLDAMRSVLRDTSQQLSTATISTLAHASASHLSYFRP